MSVIETGPGLTFSDTTDNPNMSGDRHDKMVTEHAAYGADSTIQRKAWVTGVLKLGAFPYLSKATTSGGTATFYITDDGTATGNAVFTNVYADSIAVVVYGTSANYQPFNPVVAGNNKSITISVNQTTSVLLGVLQIVSASNGVDVRLLVLGD